VRYYLACGSKPVSVGPLTTVDMSLTADVSPVVSAAEWLFVTLVWAGPIGLFVLRRQLHDARGGRLAIKSVLVGLSALTAPLAAVLILMTISGVYEDADLLWSLLKAAW
jgi:hypothetical protein